MHGYHKAFQSYKYSANLGQYKNQTRMYIEVAELSIKKNQTGTYTLSFFFLSFLDNYMRHIHFKTRVNIINGDHLDFLF